MDIVARLGRGLVGAVVGVLPGLVLFLLAEYVVKGEWQLTIGANGIMLGIGGAIGGAVVGFFWRSRS